MPRAKTKTPRKKQRTKRRAENRELTVAEGTGVKGGANGGVQTRLTDVGLAALEQLASLGLRQTSIAARLGISEAAYETVMREQDEAQLAFRRGRADLEEELSGLLVASARKGNVAAQIFGLKNLGWSDSPLHQSDPRPGPNVNIIIPPAMDDATFRRVVEGTTAAPPPGPPQPVQQVERS